MAQPFVGAIPVHRRRVRGRRQILVRYMGVMR